MSRAPSSAADHQLCERLLPHVSRTFALSIAALPDSLREAVRVAYLLCRVVDSIEDAVAVSPADRRSLFRCFDRTLADDRIDPTPQEQLWCRLRPQVEPYEQELCTHAGAVFRVFSDLPPPQRQAIRPHVQEMSRGMRHYVQRGEAHGSLRLHDMDDLERYCYFVAGTVGGLLTDLFLQQLPRIDSATRRAIEQRKVSFGVGLQLVNIVKDVAEDHRRGVCYVPRSLAREHGVSLEQLLDPAARPAAMAMVRTLCLRARDHLRAAEQYTALWPVPEGQPVRLFCIVPLALALATLTEVERGCDTLCADATPKVSRGTVMQVLSDARSAVAGNDSLSRMLGRYQPAI